MRQIFLSACIFFCLTSVVSISFSAIMYYLECSSGCNCKAGGECRCFSATTAKCQCGDCNCSPEQTLTPLSEQEFEELKAKLKAAGYPKKKSCCVFTEVTPK